MKVPVINTTAFGKPGGDHRLQFRTHPSPNARARPAPGAAIDVLLNRHRRINHLEDPAGKVDQPRTVANLTDRALRSTQDSVLVVEHPIGEELIQALEHSILRTTK